MTHRHGQSLPSEFRGDALPALSQLVSPHQTMHVIGCSYQPDLVADIGVSAFDKLQCGVDNDETPE